nr:N-acetylmuramoyl-L-alanine amidase [Maricaulis parjimensis]
MKPISAPSPNYNKRRGPIRYVVVHYTGMKTGQAALERLRDKEASVSSHYLVEEDGRLFQLVDEHHRAWHAGRGSWRGEGDLNSASIGIEIVNPGHEFGFPDYPEAQIDTVIALVRDILARHNLPPEAVIGHSDLAPGRKIDPGEKFPWDRLAREGCAAALPGEKAEGEPAALLKLIGYTLEPGLKPVVEAFQRRWRPARVDGQIDAETRALIERVASLG